LTEAEDTEKGQIGIERLQSLGPTALNHLTYLSTPKPPSILWPVKQSVEAAATEVVGTQFLTRSEVSKLLGVSPNTVTRWAREGRLACQVTLGGHHRFERELVQQLRRSLYRAGGRPD
jgi:excisionase family DNA binding protein